MTEIAKTYEANGKEITVTAQDVVDYICPLATPQEVKTFLEMCAAYGMNPYTRDAYLIKYDAKRPATMTVGKDYYTKAAARNPRCKGYQAGVSVLDPNGGFHRRKGSLVLNGETLVGAWAEVYVDGYEKPMFDEVSLSEYSQNNSMWRTKTGTMLRKVALVHALREAFPESFAGLYDSAEMGVETNEGGEPEPPQSIAQGCEQEYEEEF